MEFYRRIAVFHSIVGNDSCTNLKHSDRCCVFLCIFPTRPHILRYGEGDGKGMEPLEREKETVLQFFPEKLREPWQNCMIDWGEIAEIRLRVNCPVILRTCKGEQLLENNKRTHVMYCEKEMEDIFRHLCHDSVYAYEEERRQGYMTLEGGHRIGITGEVIYREGKGYIVKYIRYMNIRIAHEITGVAETIMPYLYKEEEPCNTLLISPPAVGKTTLLRDIIRLYADGSVLGIDENNKKHLLRNGINVGVIDERGEIAGAYRGSASLHCGIRTDVITGGDKRSGVEVLVRTFAPRIIAMDEIGNRRDAEAIDYAGVSGCAILATAHGKSLDDIERKPELAPLLEKGIFDRLVLLTKTPEGERYVQIWNQEGKELCGKKQLLQP